MDKKTRLKGIVDFFESSIPNPQTELIYNNSYELLVSVVLSAQCTDKRVNMVTPVLFSHFPSIENMAQATIDEIFEFIKSISYPNSKAKHLSKMAQIVVEKFNGKIPDNFTDLQSLPGVGRKTANVILSVLYNQPTMAVDTHVFRVSKRIGIAGKKATTPLMVEKQVLAFFPKNIIPKAHHWLILHGRYVCKAQKPLCLNCGIRNFCNYFEKEYEK